MHGGAETAHRLAKNSGLDGAHGRGRHHRKGAVHGIVRALFEPTHSGILVGRSRHRQYSYDLVAIGLAATGPGVAAIPSAEVRRQRPAQISARWVTPYCSSCSK